MHAIFPTTSLAVLIAVVSCGGSNDSKFRSASPDAGDAASGGAGGASDGGGAQGGGGSGGGGPGCGNGVSDPGEQCDRGSANSDTTPGDCSTVCRTNCQCPSCGDGVTDFAAGETCDDGGAAPGDGCSSTCTIEPITTCGNNVLDIASGEECDDNNTANGDGCNPTCNLTTTVTTLSSTIYGQLMAADGSSLWITNHSACTIDRIDINACVGSLNCTPTAVAGSGTCAATPVDGTGAAAQIAAPASITTDGNTVWFTDRHTVRALDIGTGAVTTVAGDPTRCGAIDGTGTGAYFHDVRGLTFHGGFVYLLDACEQVLRRLDPQTGVVTTLAGTRVPDPNVPQTGATAYQCPGTFGCVDGTPTDGYGTAAGFGSPRYMTADNSGNLYITDTNGQRIRAYNIATTHVRTIAGGTTGYVDGQGSAIQIERPRGIVSDGTNLYWGEQTSHTVRQLSILGGDASTLVGARGCAGTADGIGGDGTQNWSATCGAPAIAALPRLDTPLGAMAYHYPSKSIFLLHTATTTAPPPPQPQRLVRIH